MFKNVFRIVATILFFLFSFTAQAENDNFTSSHFSGSGNCATCHDGLTDTSGENVSIVRDWGASMMANATKDPFWRAKVATELKRNPHLSSVINDKCSKCHAPMANFEITQVQGGELSLFGPGGILEPDHALYDAGMNGVSCTVCHQIKDDATLGSLAGVSGNYKINDTKTIYGQFSDIFPQPMINNTGYTPQYSAHISDSAVCATCHNLKTPYVGADGVLLTTTPESEFPEQMPYTEWQNSIFDDAGSNPQSCQDCHMPKTTSKVSNRPMWLGTKDGFAKHQLVGANTTMLTLLKNNAAQLDVTSANMDLSISRARAMLQSSVNLAFVSAAVNNGVLEARVKVQNNSGHKTPTGYPSRRMWLNFKVTDSNDNIVFESGRMNADGSIIGADNDVDQTGLQPHEIMFEPHYNLITAADQVQIYEPVMGNSDNEVTYTLLRGSQYLKDNRLTPKGFNKLAVPDDVAVRGAAFGDDNFNDGSDEITYRFPVDVAGDLNVSVSLNYQTIGFGYLQDLYSDNDLEQVQTFKALYDAQSLKHEQITSVQTTVLSDGGGAPVVPVVNLSATPSTIDEGQSATLDWSSSYASSCTVSGGWSGSRDINGSEVVSPAVTTSYNINCIGDGGSASGSVTVTVNATPVSVPVVNLSASPLTIDLGQSAILNWDSSDANNCVASGGWSGSRATSGSESVSPTTTTSYTLTCDGGSTSNSVTVTVNAAPAPVPVVTLTASPLTIDLGQSATLNWDSSDANNCVASGGWSGSRATSGSESVSPTATTSYTLTCDGDGGSDSASVTVTVNDPPPPAVIQPTLNLTASPSSVRRGGTITLNWSSTDANSCSASGDWSGSKATSGSASIAINSSVTFTLTCSGDAGSVSDSVSYRARGRRWLNLQ